MSTSFFLSDDGTVTSGILTIGGTTYTTGQMLSIEHLIQYQELITTGLPKEPTDPSPRSMLSPANEDSRDEDDLSLPGQDFVVSSDGTVVSGSITLLDQTFTSGQKLTPECLTFYREIMTASM